MKYRKIIFKTTTALIAVAVLICAGIICTKGLGLVDGYDFGAGAYYYADIPGFEIIMNEDTYQAKVPVWVHILLFLGWGWFVYRLWVWIDSRK